MHAPQRLRAATAAVLALVTLAGAMQRNVRVRFATAAIAALRWPYLPGSRLELRVSGIPSPYAVTVVGPGRMLSPTTFALPLGAHPGTAFIVAGNSAGFGTLHLRIGPPPDAARPLLLVASYDDGLVIHDARDFSVAGVLATGGVPSDVAAGPSGEAVVTDTQGDEATLVTLVPWNVARVPGVATGDETAIDGATRAVFVTDRDAGDGDGALTRIAPDGRVVVVPTGQTAEGIAIDERRGIVYVANANDGTVVAVDAQTMRVLRRFTAVERVFSLALSPDGRRLYAVSNEGADTPLGRAGRVVAIDLQPVPRVVARSAALTFPIGVALDPATATLFVSDEAARAIDVLDAATLRSKHGPLKTCAIPWKLTFDAASDRLYVPCAGADKVDVFDARTLRRLAGAPFATGGYPLAVAVWPK